MKYRIQPAQPCGLFCLRSPVKVGAACWTLLDPLFRRAGGSPITRQEVKSLLEERRDDCRALGHRRPLSEDALRLHERRARLPRNFWSENCGGSFLGSWKAFSPSGF